jgi:predicted protein tyrosine phosphatase
MKRLLFLCSRNKLRSPTAETVFAAWPGVTADSAGLNRDAAVRLSAEQLEQADIVFVMEPSHRAKLSRDYKRHLHGKRVIVLGIADNYDYMDPALVMLLKAKVPRFL